MRGKLLIAACVLALSSAAAHADNFSFTGNFNNINDVQLFTFTVGASSNVVLRTWSYAGGVNAQGQTIAAGGFDPILALFQGTGATATFIDENDDGDDSAVPADPITGAHYDTYLAVNNLTPGVYTVSIMDFDNHAVGSTLGAGFTGGALPDSYCTGSGTYCDFTGHSRASHWAFDVLGVESATTPDQPPTSPVPEPSTIALLGSGLVGLARFARRRLSF